MKLIYKFLAQRHTERMQLIQAFGALGYPCYVEEKQKGILDKEYYVCVYQREK